MGTRIDGLKVVARQHKVLAALLSLYLALSAVELVRILNFDRSREYDAGFYPWEEVQIDGALRRYEWTRGDTGYILRPLWAPVVRIPLYLSRYELPPEGVTVRLYTDERLFDEVVLDAPGWHERDYYLPAVLGADPWGAGDPRMSLEGVAELDPVLGSEPFLRPRSVLQPVPDYIRAFTEWHSPPGPPSQWFRVEVSDTFVPSEHADTADDRDLGIAAGEILWSSGVPPEGLGFFPWEDLGGERIRWTGGWAFAPERASAPANGRPRGRFRLRTASTDATTDPVRVAVYWGSDRVALLELHNTAWQDAEFRLPAGASLDGVLSIRSSRTWNPGRAGLSQDNRQLGVAVTPVRWR